MLSLCPMGRIIAIDYGRKRTGLAVTDTLQMIANGLTTVPSGELTRFLADYVSREPVERFVVGLPKQMNNELSENMIRGSLCNTSEADHSGYSGRVLR